MAWQQSDLVSIRAAIASGLMEVRFADGRSQKFQDATGLLKAEARIMAALATAGPGGAGRRIRRPAYRNGA